MPGDCDTPLDAVLSRRSLLIGAGAGALFAMGGGVRAAAFPGGPVKFVVGLGPGASPDVVCRIVADQLSRLWGEQTIVLNQPGATGGIAMRTAGASAPDGRTLLFALSSGFVALPEIQSSFPYDLARDFVPVGFVGQLPMVIAASPSLGVNTLAEFTALAKQRQGQINVAVSPRGNLPHLTAEKFRLATGTDLTAIHYPATPQALNDVVSGRVQAIVDSLPGLKGSIAGGSVKLLAVCSPERLPNFPDTPAASETLPGFAALGWYALMAPPGTPEPIARQASDDLRSVLNRPEIRERLQDMGCYTRPMSPAELRGFIESEQKLWKPVVAQIGMTGK
jgi:tripartite-type tricarboxylate transporter receptor subunit TctC